MKKLNIILIMAFSFILPFTALSQTKQSNSQLIWNLLNKDKSVTTTFKNNMAQVSKNLDNCNPWIDVLSIQCKKVIDPWSTNNEKLNPKQRQISAVKNLEKAILQGKGGKALPKKLVATAQKKYPGYTQNAMSSRFKMYVKQMEWVHEDE
tara:strand:- start:338 stop:787 length:450 start_codon:yes stop_codon:yes gene_type:complete